MWDRTQRSYHNHGILGLINPAYLHLPIQFSSWEVANPRTTSPIFTSCFFNHLIFNQLSRTFKTFRTLVGNHVLFLQVTLLLLHVWYIPLHQFALTILSKCVCVSSFCHFWLQCLSTSQSKSLSRESRADAGFADSSFDAVFLLRRLTWEHTSILRVKISVLDCATGFPRPQATANTNKANCRSSSHDPSFPVSSFISRLGFSLGLPRHCVSVAPRKRQHCQQTSVRGRRLP